MKTVFFGSLLAVVVALFTAAVANAVRPTRAEAAPAAKRGEASSLIAFQVPAAEGRQQLTLIDADKRVVSIYHIDPKSGEISLKSVRDINWDLQMTEFNGASPLPREIRSLVEQK